MNLKMYYQLKAGPYLFVPDLQTEGEFRAPGGLKLSEEEIYKIAEAQSFEVEKIYKVEEEY
jgi:hypothetical protein|tara:strand:+ start:402 stop:584 length:183 start_codon:yes stop_codon:yes gene_type:complete